MIQIRKATPEDAQALLDIYAPYVTDTAITFEYDVPSVDEFRHRIETISAHYPYLVAEEDGVPVGYSYAHQLRERAAYQWCVETTIYLDKNHRHEHIGTLLYQALEEALVKQGFKNMYASITVAENESKYIPKTSPLFHQHLGFTKVGHFHKCGWKFNQWFDMIWMEKLIGDGGTPKEEILH